LLHAIIISPTSTQLLPITADRPPIVAQFALVDPNMSHAIITSQTSTQLLPITSNPPLVAPVSLLALTALSTTPLSLTITNTASAVQVQLTPCHVSQSASTTSTVDTIAHTNTAAPEKAVQKLKV
jgi:hypothetical protein